MLTNGIKNIGALQAMVLELLPLHLLPRSEADKRSQRVGSINDLHGRILKANDFFLQAKHLVREERLKLACGVLQV